MAVDIIARGMITSYTAGTNINFTENSDGTVEISASGSVSSNDSVARDAINNHKSDTSNPHNVTPSQIGLDKVDNTSDADKPISTAMQQELDKKAEKNHIHTISEISDMPSSLPANGGNADTVNGHTVNSDVPANAVFTDTWRGIQDNLTSDSAEDSLSANQGKILNEKIAGHTGDSDIHVTVSDKENWNSHPNDVQASGNPVELSGLQGGVPFSDMVVSGKNLLTYPYTHTTTTLDGITWTDNRDGSIAVNGTSTAQTWFTIFNNVTFNRGTYTLSGTQTGGQDKYDANFIWKDNNGKKHWEVDTGDGITFTLPYQVTASLLLRIYNGITCDNLVFRPQLEIGDTATAYEQPITGRELTVGVSGKNLIKYPYHTGSVEKNGITYTDNGDGTITINGTSNATSYYYLTNDSYAPTYPAGTYVLSGMPKNAVTDLKVFDLDNSVVVARDNGNGATFTLDKPTKLRIYFYFDPGKTFDNVLVKPQLEIGSAATEYEAYHGAEYTITPDSNPYTVPIDITQQDGINNIAVSEGELSVSGVRKNAAVKKIWDKISMDLLFDGVTSADNPAVVQLANYRFIEIHHIMIANEKTYPVNIRLSLDSYLSSTSTLSIPISNSTINTVHTEEGTVSSLYAISEAGDTMNNTKIYGIK